MNWDLIKEKYPKAFNLCEEQPNYYTDIHSDNDRFLYDFFDEQGINIIILTDWIYEIFIREEDGDWLERPDEYFESRTEAEEQAFLKSFEILEAKL